MSKEFDYFLHLNETLAANIKLNQIDLDSYLIEFAVAKELTTNTIQILSSSNSEQISIVDANTGTIQVNFTPTYQTGFSDTNLVYQLQVTEISSNTSNIVQEGRIFITPSLFDSITVP